MDSEPTLNEKGISQLLPCVIADAAAFLRNVDLGKLADKIFTVQEVLSEIKDAQTRQRLQVLPYEVHLREPSVESIKCVTDFSRKTGDFKSLSATDIRVLALSYQLEKEYGSGDHIKTEPTKRTEYVPKSKLVADNQMAGFYIINSKKKRKPESAGENVDSTATKESEAESVSEMEIQDGTTAALGNDWELSGEEKLDQNENGMSLEMREEAAEMPVEDLHGNVMHAAGDAALVDTTADQEMNGNEDEEDDEAGWITPNNIQDIKQQMGDDGTDQTLDVEAVKSGCLTTDFAMQNVLIQMGLHVISVDGRLIRQARSYVQKCYGCNKETPDMQRAFCQQCGNKTLMRVAVTIAPDGTMQYHYPKRRRNFNIRGTKFSLPKPEGGRHGEDIILCEDQKMRYKNMPKQRDIVSALDPDFNARDSPFAKTDTTSRAFNLGNHVKQARQRNPNASNKKSGRKKK